MITEATALIAAFECRRGDGKLRDTFEFGPTPNGFRALRTGPWSGYRSA